MLSRILHAVFLEGTDDEDLYFYDALRALIISITPCNRLTCRWFGALVEQRKGETAAYTRTMLSSLYRSASSEDVVIAVWATRCIRTRYVRISSFVTIPNCLYHFKYDAAICCYTKMSERGWWRISRNRFYCFLSCCCRAIARGGSGLSIVERLFLLYLVSPLLWLWLKSSKYKCKLRYVIVSYDVRDDAFLHH